MNNCFNIPSVSGDKVKYCTLADLAPCLPQPACPSTAGYLERKRAQKEKEMQTIQLNPTIKADLSSKPFDPTAVARQHLEMRLSEYACEKRNDLEKAYGLIDNPRPDTAQQLIDYITKGQYIVPEDKKNARTWGVPTEWFRWRDPSIKEDRDGFEKASDALYEARDAAEDTIIVKGPDAGLDAVNAFKAQTFN
jgi:hypothetical protein